MVFHYKLHTHTHTFNSTNAFTFNSNRNSLIERANERDRRNKTNGFLFVVSSAVYVRRRRFSSRGGQQRQWWLYLFMRKSISCLVWFSYLFFSFLFFSSLLFSSVFVSFRLSLGSFTFVLIVSAFISFSIYVNAPLYHVIYRLSIFFRIKSSAYFFRHFSSSSSSLISIRVSIFLISFRSKLVVFRVEIPLKRKLALAHSTCTERSFVCERARALAHTRWRCENDDKVSVCFSQVALSSMASISPVLSITSLYTLIFIVAFIAFIYYMPVSVWFFFEVSVWVFGLVIDVRCMHVMMCASTRSACTRLTSIIIVFDWWSTAIDSPEFSYFDFIVFFCALFSFWFQFSFVYIRISDDGRRTTDTIRLLGTTDSNIGFNLSTVKSLTHF